MLGGNCCAICCCIITVFPVNPAGGGGNVWCSATKCDWCKWSICCCCGSADELIVCWIRLLTGKYTFIVLVVGVVEFRLRSGEVGWNCCFRECEICEFWLWIWFGIVERRRPLHDFKLFCNVQQVIGVFFVIGDSFVDILDVVLDVTGELWIKRQESGRVMNFIRCISLKIY